MDPDPVLGEVGIHEGNGGRDDVGYFAGGEFLVVCPGKRQDINYQP